MQFPLCQHLHSGCTGISEEVARAGVSGKVWRLFDKE